MPPKVTLIVLTYNARDIVCECLDSINQVDYERLDVMVIDNNSPDDTVEVLQRDYGDRIELLALPENIKFGRAYNVGIRKALETDTDYIMLINDDTAVDRQMVRELVKVADSEETIGVVGPKIYYWQPPDQIWFAGGLIHFHKGTAEHIGIRETDHGQYDEIRDVDYITGCGLMIKRHVWEQVGSFDPIYKAYYDDADWCTRAKRAGWRLTYVPKAKMWHKISASTGGQLTWYKISNKLRSGFIFFRKYSRWYHLFTVPFHQVADVIRVLLLVARGRIRNTWEEK